MAYVKVEDNIKKFEKEGDTIEGELIAVEDGANFGNKVYKIRNLEGKVDTVFSTTILESQMNQAKIGDKVKIVYTGEKDNKKSGQNPIKTFDVFIDMK